jgi:hypothetical protein
MVALNAREKNLVDTYRALTPARRRQVLLEMARPDSNEWASFQGKGHARLADLARERGLDWEKMNDAQRQDFVEQFFEGESS